MVKVISQETFDGVVKENVEEFGLDLEEATKDAIQQFKAQGVDLSNIVTQGHSNNETPHLIITALEDLNKLIQCEKIQNSAAEDIIKLLKDVESECDIDLARRILAEKNEAFSKILKCMKLFESNNEVKQQCLKSMASLAHGYPDVVTSEGIELICQTLEEDCVNTISLGLKVVCHSCRMHENNRESFMTNFKLASKIRRLLENSPTRNHAEIVVKCCQLIRAIVSDDDVRVEFGRAHDYACMIAEQEKGIELLTSLLTEFESEDHVISELLPTLSRLAVRNEFCQRIVELGGLAFVSGVLFKYYDNKDLVESSLFLIKALAGNDDVKNEINKVDGIQLITAALERHKANAAVAEMGCAAMAALCLRTPSNSLGFVSTGAVQLLVDILKIHKLKITVERQVSMAIRNMVSRSTNITPIFLEAGVEELLQNAMKRSQKAPTAEVRAALRDLGCEVHLQELWTGKGVSTSND